MSDPLSDIQSAAQAYSRIFSEVPAQVDSAQIQVAANHGGNYLNGFLRDVFAPVNAVIDSLTPAESVQIIIGLVGLVYILGK